MKYFVLGVICTLAVMNPEATKKLLAKGVDATNVVVQTTMKTVDNVKEQ